MQTPEERFGPSEPALPAEMPPDPFVAVPPTRSGNRRKARHERHKFEREAHHLPPRRVSKRRAETRRAAPKPSSAPQRKAASPAMERIRFNRRRKLRRALGVLALTIFAGATAFAFYAPQMRVESVDISGLHATSPEFVQPIADRLIGHNVFLAPKSAVVSSVKRLPTVADARVAFRAAIPPRVELKVWERKPLVRVGDGTRWWVADRKGMPFRTASERDAHLPLLRWEGAIQTMKAFDQTRWSDAVRLVEAVRGAQQKTQNGQDALPPVRGMKLGASGDATLWLDQKPNVPALKLVLGSDEWAEKLVRARVALSYFERTRRDAGELNLISLNLPRWTPRAR